MTYQELKTRLSKCETTLQDLKDGSYRNITNSAKQTKIAELLLVKESLTKRLNEAEDKGVIYTDDEKQAEKLAAGGSNVKITKEEEGMKFSVEETKTIARSVGKAVAIGLKNLGDEIGSMKAKNIEENSFEIYVEYKNDKTDTFSFYIVEDTLHLTDFSFNVEIGDVGVKPSGEAQINVDVIANELQKHWSSQNEGMTDQEFSDAQKASRLEKHPEKDMIKKIQALIAKEKSSISEGPYQTTYIKVAQNDYKEAIQVIDDAIDPTYVKTDIVDDDGDGNVIIYFNFRASDDGEPSEDMGAFIYDVAHDLQARGINPTAASHDIDESAKDKSEKNYSDYHKDNESVEEIDVNDPVLMKMRASKAKPQGTIERKSKIETLAKVKDLQRLRNQVMRDMEQEAEPEGGPVADDYGRQLNDIDSIISALKAGTDKDVSEDEFAGEDNLITFGFDLDYIQEVVDHLESNYREGQDYELHVGRGDTHPNAVTIKNPQLHKDADLNDMLNAAQGDEDSYDDDEALSPEELANKHAGSPMREDEEEDAKNDADYEAGWHDDPRQDEDTDVGHQDDEPNMLKSSAMETAEYAAKLYKKLDRYDNQDGEVDFPNWWQKKLILAREYMSSAYHYLDSEEKQPAMDQLALEENVDKVAAGYPYRQHGNKVIITEPMDDATKERMLRRAKEYGYFAGPNQAGGITITLKQGTYEGQDNEKEIQGQEMVDYIMKNWNWSEDKTLNFLAKRLGNKEENLKEELSGDQRDALMDLQNVLDQAAQLGDEARQIVKDHFPQELNAGEAYDVFNFGSSTNSYDKTLETLIGDIEMAAEDDDDDYLEEGLAKTKKAHDKVVTIMKDLAKKYKGGDKSVIDQLKTLTITKKKLEVMLDKDVAGTGVDQELDEAGPGFAHDCAAKVVHETYGKGKCIPEKHTLVKEGKKYVVTHYDVLFENGKTVKDIPVKELDIKTTNEHWHKGYKKKKK